ncbi:MAG: hypothetical protein ICV66_06295 [Chitinophagaceae bacterium]|nr:hypothetical protein [Chitinophagaceae bacterium]
MIKYSLVVLLIGLFSCGIYRQNVVNAPLMQQKGQTQLSGHISFNGWEGQAAYALTNKIAVLANYGDMGIKKELYSSINYETRKHHFKEIGAGMYKKTAAGRIRELFVFAGKGMTSHFIMGRTATGAISATNQEVDYSRFAIQADAGSKNKNLEYVLTPRLLAVHYYNIVDNARSDYQNLSNFHIYAEGAVTLRYPILKFLMISGQACATLPLTHSGGYNYYYEFSPFNGSIGLIFNIDLLKSFK